MPKLILIGMFLWAIGVLLCVHNEQSSSYAKGFQVRMCDKQWRV